ncbi:MAG: hypothetical protein AVDCRST_MAG93-1445 [uncultured Chloroflexia bacterium]|uniref:Uncharacterized protein n=1 Tax=uncultured Chloroflexia bacterium TaxID=1672391 RepID=A0A6J4I836_9CHLR|nr:MAG: hypothetical protein AVDCRST_MAG93-1445 [uncultured Chloroflexia bacterium]
MSDMPCTISHNVRPEVSCAYPGSPAFDRLRPRLDRPSGNQRIVVDAVGPR